MDYRSELFALQDKDYADFQAKLTPTVARDCFIGVRMPQMRTLAKKLAKNPAHEEYLMSLPHEYYDENMLHGLLIAREKSFDRCVEKLEAFLPYVDNWAVCDCMSPKVLAKNKDKLLEKIRQWTGSEHTYTIRFGMDMLMSHFLDDDFDAALLEIPLGIRSEEYYVRMMNAWFFATALAKQWDAVLPVFTENRLDVWTHNKSIQKAVESRRITDEQKAYLRLMKRKDT